MADVIHVNFKPEFREGLAQMIKSLGVKHVREMGLAEDAHPSFVNAIIKSIMRREGW